MQYIIYAPDNKNTLNKRLAVREEHINMGDKYRDEGKHIFGAAMLDGDGNMNGSVMAVEFETKKDLDEWLKKEPYIKGGVWNMDEIRIIPCKVGPSFLNK